MGLFQKVEGEVVIIHDRGTFKQLDVYAWNGFLFAKLGAGYVRLNADGSTSKPTATIRQLTWTGALNADTFGRLALPDTQGTRTVSDTTKLLGGPSNA